MNLNNKSHKANLLTQASLIWGILLLLSCSDKGTESFSLRCASGKLNLGKASFEEDNKATRVTLKLENLTPNQTYTAKLHGGNCSQLSASFTSIATVTADKDGKATYNGPVRFRDKEPVAYDQLIGQEHALVIASEAQSVCCVIDMR